MKLSLKKCAAILAALCLTAGMAGCEGENKPSSNTSSQAVTSSAEGSAVSGTEPGDASQAELDYGLGLDDRGCFEGVKALDYVTLPENYLEMEIPEDVSTVDEEEIQEQIDGITSELSDVKQVKDRAVEDGDTVNIDYVGSVDDVEFSGGNTQGNGTTVTIGVTSYIDDFLEQLIGHMPGDTFDVNVTFPEPYPNNTDLSGKDAVFKTTINYIEEKEAVELTDSLIQENFENQYGWSTVEEMKQGIEKTLRGNAIFQYVWSQIQENSEIQEIPQGIADFQRHQFDLPYLEAAQNNGQTVDEYLQQQGGSTLEELAQAQQATFDARAKQSILLQALSEDLGIEPKDEDVAAYFADNFGSEDYSLYEERYGMPYIRMAVRETMTKDKLAEKIEANNGIS